MLIFTILRQNSILTLLFINSQLCQRGETLCEAPIHERPNQVPGGLLPALCQRCVGSLTSHRVCEQVSVVSRQLRFTVLIPEDLKVLPFANEICKPAGLLAQSHSSFEPAINHTIVPFSVNSAIGRRRLLRLFKMPAWLLLYFKQIDDTRTPARCGQHITHAHNNLNSIIGSHVQLFQPRQHT